jgi:hypothetical protein
MTEHSRRVDFDELMRALTVIGFVALAAWIATSGLGLIAGYIAVSPPATLRFLLAVLVLVFARRTYWEIREWRWGKLPPDERFGFTNPLASRAEPAGPDRVGDPADTGPAATGSSHPRA